MRQGEIRGLQWGDISNGIIIIRHNFVDGDGLKAPKCASTRTVPFPASVKIILESVRKTSKNTSPECFIFEQLNAPEIPATKQFLRHAFERELTGIGITGDWLRWKKVKAPDGYVNEQKKTQFNISFTASYIYYIRTYCGNYRY